MRGLSGDRWHDFTQLNPHFAEIPEIFSGDVVAGIGGQGMQFFKITKRESKQNSNKMFKN